MKILFCSFHAASALRLLDLQLSDHQMITCSPNNVAKHLDGVDILILWVPTTIDASIINSGKFGFVQQCGVGLKTVDIEAATDAGVWIARVPGSISGSADSVAEHTIMLMLMLSRRFSRRQQIYLSQDWSQQKGIALLGKTACLVGLGDVGKLRRI